MKSLLSWCMLLICLSKAALPQTVVYPDDRDFQKTNRLSQSCSGKCRSIRHCPYALQLLFNNPETCYLRQYDVCCEHSPYSRIEERAAVRACFAKRDLPAFISNGFETDYREFPSMVALGWPTSRRNLYDFKCGGILIEANFVLTAAHCASRTGDQPAVVFPGGDKLSKAIHNPYSLYRIKKIYVHPSYNARREYHDIALIELQDKILDPSLACLWPRHEIDQTNFTVLGYGNTQFAGLPSDSLLKAYVFHLPKANCQRYHVPNSNIPLGLLDQQLCAWDPIGRRDTCQSDSGGPLLIQKMERERFITYVVGITSTGNACGLSTPGIYTRVSAYLDWIESIVWPSVDFKSQKRNANSKQYLSPIN